MLENEKGSRLEEKDENSRVKSVFPIFNHLKYLSNIKLRNMEDPLAIKISHQYKWPNRKGSGQE